MSQDGMTDQDYVDEFGVPQELANTPGINKWLIQDTYDKNLDLEYQHAIKLGRTKEEANAWAKKIAEKGKRDAWHTVHKVQKGRGF